MARVLTARERTVPDSRLVPRIFSDVWFYRDLGARSVDALFDPIFDGRFIEAGGALRELYRAWKLLLGGQRVQVGSTQTRTPQNFWQTQNAGGHR